MPGPQGGTPGNECNFTGWFPCLQAAEAFETRGSGLLIGLSSWRERGWFSNYATVGVAGFSRFSACGRGFGIRVRVLTVKPGYAATGMIAGRRLPGIVASPELVARDILRAVRTADALYPGWWRPFSLNRAPPEVQAFSRRRRGRRGEED
ncbi:MAG: hypothetical protein ACLR0N_19040 [Bilophila wadsworthia]